MTRLRRMMLEELQRRNYSTKTIPYYLQAVADFARHFGRSPDKLGLNELRSYQARRQAIRLVRQDERFNRIGRPLHRSIGDKPCRDGDDRAGNQQSPVCQVRPRLYRRRQGVLRRSGYCTVLSSLSAVADRRDSRFWHRTRFAENHLVLVRHFRSRPAVHGLQRRDGPANRGRRPAGCSYGTSGDRA